MEIIDGGISRTTPVQFSYVHPTAGVKMLNLRLNPNSVDWTYELNTNVVNTYGGQVVQILGLKLGQLNIEGQFGREGPWGLKKVKDEYVRRRGTKMTGWAPKDPDEQLDYSDDGLYGIGLTEMLQFFRDYFSASTQGGSSSISGRYIQAPMTLAYDDIHIAAATNDADQPTWSEWNATPGTWMIIPVDFPSYKRSNENFAPEWKVTAEIVQAPLHLMENTIEKSIARLHAAIGFKPLSPWNAPLEERQAVEAIKSKITIWHQMLPNFANADLTNLFYQAVSTPNVDIEVPEDDEDFGVGGGLP